MNKLLGAIGDTIQAIFKMFKNFVNDEKYIGGFIVGFIACFVLMIFLFDEVGSILGRINEIDEKLTRIEDNYIDFGDVCEATGNKTKVCQEYWVELIKLAEEKKMPQEAIRLLLRQSLSKEENINNKKDPLGLFDKKETKKDKQTKVYSF